VFADVPEDGTLAQEEISAHCCQSFGRATTITRSRSPATPTTA
jgi:hypothetical protein